MSARTTRRRVGQVALGLASAVTMGVLAAPSAQAAPVVHDWTGVAECESGGDWSINTGNGYYGGLQFSQATWNGAAAAAGIDVARADLATPQQQMEAAEELLAQGLTPQSQWPVCSKYLTTATGGTTASGGSTPTPAPAPAPTTTGTAAPDSPTQDAGDLGESWTSGRTESAGSQPADPGTGSGHPTTAATDEEWDPQRWNTLNEAAGTQVGVSLATAGEADLRDQGRQQVQLREVSSARSTGRGGDGEDGGRGGDRGGWFDGQDDEGQDWPSPGTGTGSASTGTGSATTGTATEEEGPATSSGTGSSSTDTGPQPAGNANTLPQTEATEQASADAAPADAAPAAPAAGTSTTTTANITNSAGSVAPQTQAAANAVVSNVPGAESITLGGTRASAADPGGHPSGLAVDYMVGSDAALGDAIVEYHIAHWDELGVDYIIWQQRILSSPDGAWKAMADRGSATANHMDHPHVNYVG